MERLRLRRYNKDGILGLGDTMNRGDTANQMGDALPFVSLGTGQRASAMATGGYHTCALLAAGIKCWGCVSLARTLFVALLSLVLHPLKRSTSSVPREYACYCN